MGLVGQKWRTTWNGGIPHIQLSHWSSGGGGGVCCCISLQPHCRMVWLKPHAFCCSRGADMCRLKGMRYAQGEWRGPRAARILCGYFLFNNGHHSIVSELPITYYMYICDIQFGQHWLQEVVFCFTSPKCFCDWLRNNCYCTVFNVGYDQLGVYLLIYLRGNVFQLIFKELVSLCLRKVHTRHKTYSLWQFCQPRFRKQKPMPWQPL